MQYIIIIYLASIIISCAFFYESYRIGAYDYAEINEDQKDTVKYAPFIPVLNSIIAGIVIYTYAVILIEKVRRN